MNESVFSKKFIDYDFVSSMTSMATRRSTAASKRSQMKNSISIRKKAFPSNLNSSVKGLSSNLSMGSSLSSFQTAPRRYFGNSGGANSAWVTQMATPVRSRRPSVTGANEGTEEDLTRAQLHSSP